MTLGQWLETAESFLRGLPEHSLFPWLEIALALLIGVFGYRWGRKTKKPRWDARTHRIIEDHGGVTEELSVLYNEEEIDVLSVTRLALWNAGDEILEERDIPSRDPLRIVPGENVQVLDVSILSQSHDGVDFRTEDEGDEIDLSFEYMGENDGVVLQLIHTAEPGEELTLEGRIKGAGKFERKTGSQFSTRAMSAALEESGLLSNPSSSQRRWIAAVSFLAIGIGFALLAWFTPSWDPQLVFGALALLYVLSGFSALRRGTPKELQLYQEPPG